jgi:hypothetical protein
MVYATWEAPTPPEPGPLEEAREPSDGGVPSADGGLSGRLEVVVGPPPLDSVHQPPREASVSPAPATSTRHRGDPRPIGAGARLRYRLSHQDVLDVAVETCPRRMDVRMRVVGPPVPSGDGFDDSVVRPFIASEEGCSHERGDPPRLRVVAPAAGEYRLEVRCVPRRGLYFGGECQNRFSYTVESERLEVVEVPARGDLRHDHAGLLAFQVRGWFAGGEGHDFMFGQIGVAWWPFESLVLRAGGLVSVAASQPVGAAHLTVSYDVRWVEIGLGAGVATLSTSRFGAPLPREVPVAVARLRVGEFEGAVWLDAQAHLAHFDEEVHLVSLRGELGLRLSRWFSFRLVGAGGLDGNNYGELSGIFGDHDRTGLRVGAFFGGGVVAGQFSEGERFIVGLGVNGYVR